VLLVLRRFGSNRYGRLRGTRRFIRFLRVSRSVTLESGLKGNPKRFMPLSAIVPMFHLKTLVFVVYAVSLFVLTIPSTALNAAGQFGSITPR
jgi:hypothetical protein